ncbi:MAG: DUF4340 domain-containing protein [Anaerolineae bacterium]|uniref:DUF4340 domain-containing protein n=1 Tax=Candidatus Amarolinea dominans TaxID=3140696 RepID=UPI0031370497|nr:DUF4340 domain-containing protein [Anaerolineae bacterium]
MTSLKISDQDKNMVELKKLGSDWVLADADSFPADASKVTPILDKIAAIKTNRLVTRTSDSHKRLQVAADDFLRKVEFTLSSGAAHTLFIGSAPGTRATHVRADQQSEVFLASDLSSYEVGAQETSWIKTTYVSITQTEMIGLTVTNITGTLQFSEGRIWRLDARCPARGRRSTRARSPRWSARPPMSPCSSRWASRLSQNMAWTSRRPSSPRASSRAISRSRP